MRAQSRFHALDVPARVRSVGRAREGEGCGGVWSAHSDWYLFAAGLDYTLALRDLSSLSGSQPIPPRYAFGVWFSRWWPWGSWEAESLLKEFDERGVPCDVLITDMDWHHTCYRRTYGNASEKSMDASNNWPCWSGFTFDKKYFNNPEDFLGWCKARGVHNGFNLHFQSGLVKAEEDQSVGGLRVSDEAAAERVHARPPRACRVRTLRSAEQKVLKRTSTRTSLGRLSVRASISGG